MSILNRNITEFIGFLVLCPVLFVSCYSQPTLKKIEIKPVLTKDSIMMIIQNIAEYIATHDVCRAGVDSMVNILEKKYKMSFSNEFDSASILCISTSTNIIDSTENGVYISFPIRNNMLEISFTDLSKNFGQYEDCIFDKKIPLPKDIRGSYVVYPLVTKSKKTVYMQAASYLNNNVDRLHIKKEKRFGWLTNT